MRKRPKKSLTLSWEALNAIERNMEIMPGVRSRSAVADYLIRRGDEVVTREGTMSLALTPEQLAEYIPDELAALAKRDRGNRARWRGYLWTLGHISANCGDGPNLPLLDFVRDDPDFQAAYIAGYMYRIPR